MEISACDIEKWWDSRRDYDPYATPFPINVDLAFGGRGLGGFSLRLRSIVNTYTPNFKKRQFAFIFFSDGGSKFALKWKREKELSCKSQVFSIKQNNFINSAVHTVPFSFPRTVLNQFQNFRFWTSYVLACRDLPHEIRILI